MSVQLDTAVQYLPGVGAKRANMLAKAGIHSVEDLLRYRPFRYEDRSRFQPVAGLRSGEEAVIQGEILTAGSYTTSRRKVQIFEMIVGDQSAMIAVKFFNQPYLKRILAKGKMVILFGVPHDDSFSGGLSMINPEFELVESDAEQTIHTGRIVPVYRKIGSLTTRHLRQILFHAVERIEIEPADPIPGEVLSRYHWPSLIDAFRQLHFPHCPPGSAREVCLNQLAAGQSPAHQRFIFEEFFRFQLGLLVARRLRRENVKSRRIQPDRRIREIIKSVLPFHPTTAQKRVLKEIVEDISSTRLMARLLQGDVGSGKTIVAVQAIIVVMANGYQAALMAPTEILAEQHYRNMLRYLKKTDFTVAFLSSRVRGRSRKEMLSLLETGKADLVVGTQALIQEDVRFKNLALVVIDEQHRFGVVQRSVLQEKGSRPDTLIMTATPIPRSLALTLYGDLDISVLDELPPGRWPVKTVVKTEAGRKDVYQLLEQELKKGRQAYVVYPLIEQSEKVDLKAATEMAAMLQKEVFSEYRVGLMHGRLKGAEKEELMRGFESGQIHILVSTTVIEVGIDVPNATVMVIEHAERFGLSQLHQLRGRIGRGCEGGFCILMVDKISSREAYERVDIMRKSSDGFKIAEKDLELRGPGEFVGRKQSGVPDFLFANLVRDRKWLEVARQEAARRLEEMLARTPQERTETLASLDRQWRARYGLFEVG